MNLHEMAMQGPAGQGAGAAAPGGKTPASAEQQAQFDMILGRARQLLGESAQEWRAAMDIDPAGAAVRFGTATLRFLAMESEKAGQPVDPAVLLHAGVQFVKDVAGLANDAGLVPDDQLEPFLQRVMQESIAEYMRLDADAGLMPPTRGAAPRRPPPPGTGPQTAHGAHVALPQGGVQ